MIGNIGSNPAVDLLAQAASKPTAPPAPGTGAPEVAAPLPLGSGQAPDAGARTAEAAPKPAAEAPSGVLDNIGAGALAGSSAHPNEVRLIRDNDSGMVAVQIRDAITGDEISQIPSEKMIKTMASISKTIGLLLDKNA